MARTDLTHQAPVAADALQAEFERTLGEILAQTGCRRILVALSGGLDSSVLLDLVARSRTTLAVACAAVHVDHGLHDHSAAWAAHCVSVAGELGIGCEVVSVEGSPPAGASVEAWAREQRYRALERLQAADTCVMTAHHADDQMETVVQRMLWGAGPHGLSGIRPLRRLGTGFLARPLLAWRRATLEGYAARRRLSWIDDPSNQEARYVRNRLRQRVMPVLESAVPAAAGNLLLFASLQSELAGLLDKLADDVLAAGGLPRHQLAVASVLATEPRLRPYIVKRWLDLAGAPRPTRRHLHELLHGLLYAREDANPVLRIDDCGVRRYRGVLYLVPGPLPAAPVEPLPWTPSSALELPWGRLSLRASVAGGIAAEHVDRARLSVRFRGGGERCRPSARAHTHTLKKLFQEWAVPPWERALVPLLFCDGQLAAVGSYCVCAGFAADAGAAAYALDWRPALYSPHARP